MLEVGAGQGELAYDLTKLGYDVIAIDPNSDAEGVVRVARADLDEPPRSFDAAVALVSLHHVEPLEASMRRLAEVVRPGATLLIDEFDVAQFDDRVATWLLERRRELGTGDYFDPETAVAELRAELHPLATIEHALASEFALGAPIRGGYLYRWGLDEGLRGAEEEAIGAGLIPAVGARLTGRRRR